MNSNHQEFRSNPADSIENGALTEDMARHSAALMRVNHAGEISAQALYMGQAMTAQDPTVRKSMLDSADEEIDHLYWCRQRLDDLGSHVSYLDPVWYAGSYSIGTVVGCLGDKLSLGFIAETEFQVIKHLDSHLNQLPDEDRKSRAVIEQMKIDEGKHASKAIESGAIELPDPIKKIMEMCSKVMTKTAYWL